MSSSSSEDEKECLKEALDPTFFSNDLFQQKTTSETKERAVQLPPSVRNQNQSWRSYNPLGIKVTPEFRTHVSKKLHQLLDKIIDDTEELPLKKKRKSKNKHKHEIRGVKLLRTSFEFLNGAETEDPIIPKKKKCKKMKIDDDLRIYEERAKEVAVTADWILSGKATEGWAENTGGKLEVITISSCNKE